MPRAKYTVLGGNRLVVAGLLSWLGLSQETEPDHDLIVTIKRGMLAAQEGDLKKADQIFHIALQMASSMGHVEGETHIYALMANTALDRGFIGQAERLFTEVLKRILAAGESQDSNAVVEISLKLATIFNAQNNFTKAEQGFEFCIKTTRSKVEKEGELCDKDTLALYGLSLDRQGQFLLGRGRLEEAESAFSTAVGVAKKVYGPDDEQTLVIRNSLATVLSLRGETIAAISLLSQLVEEAQTTDSQFLATFLINRGIVELRNGRGFAAEEDCGRAKQVAKSRRDKEAVQEADKCLEDILQLMKPHTVKSLPNS